MADDDIVIEIDDPVHAGFIWRLVGACEVMDALISAREEYGDNVGLGLAIALAEKEVADLRATMAGYSLRAVARYGYDINDYGQIGTQIRDNRPVMVIEGQTDEG